MSCPRFRITPIHLSGKNRTPGTRVTSVNLLVGVERCGVCHFVMAAGKSEKKDTKKKDSHGGHGTEAREGSSTMNSGSSNKMKQVSDADPDKKKSGEMSTKHISPDQAKPGHGGHVGSGSGSSTGGAAAGNVFGLPDLTAAISSAMKEGLKQVSFTMEKNLSTMNENLQAVINWQNDGGELFFEPATGVADDPITAVTMPEASAADTASHVPSENLVWAENEAQDGGPDESGDSPPAKRPRISTGKEKFLSKLVTSKEDEVLGEPLRDEALAQKITALMREKPTTDFDRDGLKSILRPGNCPGLAPVRVNENIWHELGRNMQTSDANMQRVQLPLVKGATAVARITDIVLANYDEATGAVGFDANATELVFDLLNKALGCLGAANFETVQRRREKLKSEINPEFGNICAQAHPYTDWLFGDDINKKVEDISIVNKISKKIVKTSSPSNHRGKRLPGHPQGAGRGGQGGYYYPQHKFGYQQYYWQRGHNARGRAYMRGRGRGRTPFLGYCPPYPTQQSQNQTQSQPQTQSQAKKN